MYSPVATKDPFAVQNEVQGIYLGIFPQGEPAFMPRVFGWALECFTGKHQDYLPVDARYHDIEHTMQGTLCLARLLRGRHVAGAQPSLTAHMFELAIIAILFHDTGYLKKRDDPQGTGEKYTVTHVIRSSDFAVAVLEEQGFNGKDIRAVQNMIHCTGVNTNLAAIPFQSDPERVAGFALATADLLGQMSAPDYVEKLPILYSEFAEAAEFTGDKNHFVSSFSSARDLLERTPDFWHAFVLPKLEKDFLGLYRFLNEPYPDGPNQYVQGVKANMGRLRQTSGEAVA